jgi:hypothetical protein
LQRPRAIARSSADKLPSSLTVQYGVCKNLSNGSLRDDVVRLKFLRLLQAVRAPLSDRVLVQGQGRVPPTLLPCTNSCRHPCTIRIRAATATTGRCHSSWSRTSSATSTAASSRRDSPGPAAGTVGRCPDRLLVEGAWRAPFVQCTVQGRGGDTLGGRGLPGGPERLWES